MMEWDSYQKSKGIVSKPLPSDKTFNKGKYIGIKSTAIMDIAEMTL